MWYVIPTPPFIVNGVEMGSQINKRYCIRDQEEAEAFLAFTANGVNLRSNYLAMMEAIREKLLAGISAIALVGSADEPKLVSSVRFFEKLTRMVNDEALNDVCYEVLSLMRIHPDSDCDPLFPCESRPPRRRSPSPSRFASPTRSPSGRWRLSSGLPVGFGPDISQNCGGGAEARICKAAELGTRSSSPSPFSMAQKTGGPRATALRASGREGRRAGTSPSPPASLQLPVKLARADMLEAAEPSTFSWSPTQVASTSRSGGLPRATALRAQCREDRKLVSSPSPTVGFRECRRSSPSPPSLPLKEVRSVEDVDTTLAQSITKCGQTPKGGSQRRRIAPQTLGSPQVIRRGVMNGTESPSRRGVRNANESPSRRGTMNANESPSRREAIQSKCSSTIGFGMGSSSPSRRPRRATLEGVVSTGLHVVVAAV